MKTTLRGVAELSSMCPLRRWLRGLVGALLIVICLQASAVRANLMWIGDEDGTLVTVNVTTQATTLIGQMGIPMTDLAFAPNGTLYAINFTDLYTINTTTAARTHIGDFGSGIPSLNALTFGADGTLYAAGPDNEVLYTLNIATGAATAKAGDTQGESAGDLSFFKGELFMTSTQGANQFIKVDPSTGNGTSLGDMGPGNFYGLGTPDNATLYTVAGNTIYSVDSSTGAVTSLFTYDDLGGLADAAFGASFAAVPEVSSFAFLGLAAAAVGTGRRWTRRLRIAK